MGFILKLSFIMLRLVVFIVSAMICYGSARNPLASKDREDCQTCKSAVGAIFKEMLKPTVQTLLVQEFRKDLNCDTDPSMVDDILCSEDAEKILLWLGEKVGFSQEEANTICEEMEGACENAWTTASCVDDVKDILYPRLIDPKNLKHLLEEAIEKYQDVIPLFNDLDEIETEAQWKEDMEKLVKTGRDLYGNIGPGILCGLVDKALD